MLKRVLAGSNRSQTRLALAEQPRVVLWRFSLPRSLARALLFSQLMALVWWLAALGVNGLGLAFVWTDQGGIFMPAAQQFGAPYQVHGFINPPYTALLLLPFSLLPLPLSILLQLCIYFAALTGVIFKFGGGLRETVLALSSFIALDNALELNVDWFTCLALLLPAAWSVPLMIIKPQNALSVYLLENRQNILKVILAGLLTLAVTLPFWGFWPVDMLEAARSNLGWQWANLAPMHILSAPVSIVLGLLVGYIAFRQRDPILMILAWLFFIPYIKLYSLLLHFALAAVRWWRVTVIISVCMWVIYVGVIVLAVLSTPA